MTNQQTNNTNPSPDLPSNKPAPSSSTTPAPTSNNSTTSALPPPSAAARQRFASTHEPSPSPNRPPRREPTLRRRSSLLSFSSFDDTQSFADELINPRTSRARKTQDDIEPSHWHSSPLAFAILPAIGGLLFHNGSAIVTDILLLGLAALFMNWSIRIPWDWYFSAQALRRDVHPDSSLVEDDLDENDDLAVETASETGGSPKSSPNRRRNKGTIEEDTPVQDLDKREQAAADLRRQEVAALAMTFIFPVLAAYLLHVIRAQLSGPSTSLVSDYNLSIFLLAAEVRPVRHVIRLIANRTLHLQRTVTGIDDPFSSAVEEKTTITSLLARVAELESKLADQIAVPQNISMAQKADVNNVSLEIRKRYEPRLEGLERAMRRYEKRSTAMVIHTENRLQQLEGRLEDALSLAAVAAKYSQNRGIVVKGLETASKIIAFPMWIGKETVLIPFKLVEDLYAKTRTVLLGPMPPRQGKRRAGKHDGNGKDEKPKDKPSRRIVR